MEWNEFATAGDAKPEGAELTQLGITRAAARGVRTMYRLAGAQGLSQLSMGTTLTSREPGAFRACLVSAPLEEIAYEEITATPFLAERSRSQIAEDQFDAIRLSLLTDGVVDLEVDGARTRIGAGELYVVDMARPFRAELPQASRQSTVVIPRHLLRLIPGRIDLIRAQPLPSSALASVFIGMLQGLARQAPDDNSVEAELLAHALVDIAQGVCRTPDRGIGIDPEDVVMRRRVRALIEREFRLPRFKMADIAQRLRVSVRYLHRLFEAEPLSIAQLIRQRRVQELQRGLATSSERFETIARHSGFGSMDAAYRAFKDVTGVTPSAYRADPGSVSLVFGTPVDEPSELGVDAPDTRSSAHARALRYASTAALSAASVQPGSART